MKIGRRYTFEAAHMLPFVPEGHKCGRTHGHSYTLEVEVVGSTDPKTGWLIDYAEIDRVVNPLVLMLDHHTLNEVPGLSNPTAEVLCAWFVERLHGKFGRCKISRVRVSETGRSWAELP